MEIREEDWAEASGGVAQDGHGGIWRIIGFINQPAVILEPVDMLAQEMSGGGQRAVIMGTEHSENWAWLRRQPPP